MTPEELHSQIIGGGGPRDLVTSDAFILADQRARMYEQLYRAAYHYYKNLERLIFVLIIVGAVEGICLVVEYAK